MKKNILISVLAILAFGFGLTSCLDGDEMNTPPGGSPTLVEMSFVAPGGTTMNSGLAQFGAQALFLKQAADTDTVTFAVTIQGAPVDHDVNVTLAVDEAARLDNFAADQIDYALLSSDQYKLVSTTGTIPAGKNYVEFKVAFYPPNIDFTESTILPIKVTNDSELVTSTTYGKLYLHIIGNPIAGLYTQQFIRIPDSGTSFTGRKNQVFSPNNPTQITVKGTGYYDNCPYIITFKDDGAGNLTEFRAVLDPVWVAANWDPVPISITGGPTISVSPDYKKFTIHYTTATRDCTDIFVRQ